MRKRKMRYDKDMISTQEKKRDILCCYESIEIK